MPQPNPAAVATAIKRTTTLLRDVRSVLRRLDPVLANARAHSNSSEPAIAEARDAIERLVTQFTFRERSEHHHARQAVCHLR